MESSNAKQWMGWWLLLIFALLLIVMGFQGSVGRMLAVLVAPNHLMVEKP